jgi:hypothetical protein
MKKYIASISVLIIGLILQIDCVFAAHSYGMALNDSPDPSKFEFTYDWKTPLGGSITLTNYEKNDPVRIFMAGVDGLINDTGEFYYKTLDQDQTKIGKWMEFEEADVTLQPGEEKVIRFRFNIPDKVMPGYYVGAISSQELVTEEAKTAETGNQVFGAKVQTRRVKQVMLNIPGEKISKYNLGELTSKRVGKDREFSFTIANEGNSLLAGKGTLEISDETGLVNIIPINISGIMEGDDFNGIYRWPNTPEWGKFSATLKLEISEYDPFTETYSVLEKTDRKTTFQHTNYPSMLPYAYGIIAFILLLFALVLKSYLYRRGCIEYIVQPSETIKSIADKNGMNWKKLVKINHIKPPYELSAGTKILVRPAHHA